MKYKTYLGYLLLIVGIFMFFGLLAITSPNKNDACKMKMVEMNYPVADILALCGK